MRIGLSLVSICLLCAVVCAQERKVDTAAVDSEFRQEATADSVVLSLVDQLDKSETEARDAATKLCQIGKRAVPILADLVDRAPSPQVRFYAAVSLSRIRHPLAAQAMLPLLKGKDVSREMRLLAIESAAGSGLDAATGPLAALVDSDDDAELRLKALQALSVMPVAWRDCEAMFAKTLLDPNEEIRLLGTQVCFYAAAVKIVYGAAEPTLLELVEKDPSETVRCRGLRALARMKSGRAVPLCVRLLEDATTSRDLSRQALAAIQTITQVPVQDSAAVQRWWEKHGKMNYANAPALKPFTVPKDKEKVAAGSFVESPEKNDPTTSPPAEKRPARTPDATAAGKGASGESRPATAVTPPPATPAASRPTPTQPAGRRPILDEGDDRPLSGVPIR